jgi:hypothetical protein
MTQHIIPTSIIAETMYTSEGLLGVMDCVLMSMKISLQAKSLLTTTTLEPSSVLAIIVCITLSDARENGNTLFTGKRGPLLDLSRSFMGWAAYGLVSSFKVLC